jgi:hypothetical protein
MCPTLHWKKQNTKMYVTSNISIITVKIFFEQKYLDEISRLRGCGLYEKIDEISKSFFKILYIFLSHLGTS